MLYIVLNVFFLLLLLVFYYLLFPARAGDTSRISLPDRLILAVRLALSRAKLIFFPITEIPFVHNKKQITKRKKNKKEKDSDDSDDITGNNGNSNEKFMSASEAIERFIRPNDVLYFCGFAATDSPCVWFHALKKIVLNKNNHNRNNLKNLTIITQTGSSTRGVGSDSLDDVLCAVLSSSSSSVIVRRLIAGHLETLVGTLRRISSSAASSSQKLEVYNIPLGVISRLVGAQSSSSSPSVASQQEEEEEGEEDVESIETTVGLESFLDPATFSSSKNKHDYAPVGYKLTSNCTLHDLVRVKEVKQTKQKKQQQEEGERKSSNNNHDNDPFDKNARLIYTMPKITVSLCHARYADSEGNVYFDENTILGDSLAAAKAARKHGGFVLVSVQEIRQKNEMKKKKKNNNEKSTVMMTMLPASQVDAIVRASSVLLQDFSGLARYCRMPTSSSSSSSSCNSNDKEEENSLLTVTRKNKMNREEVCELWERASLAWAYATTFHPRWRQTLRDAPFVTHCHDEVIRLAKGIALQQKQNQQKEKEEETLPVIRVMIGVSVPEMVSMRLAESGAAFLGTSETQRPIDFSLEAEGKYVEKKLLSFEEQKQRLLDNNNNNKKKKKKKKQREGNHQQEEEEEEEEDFVTPIQFVVESGVVGGLPSPGFLFGNSFNPHKILEAPTFWNLMAEKSFVHMCVLGAGEVDVEGCVNASKSGGSDEEGDDFENLKNVIGCGGYPDIVAGVTRAIVIVLKVKSSGTRFQRKKRPEGGGGEKHHSSSCCSSIVQKVQQVTFSPFRALRSGVCVRYCTEIGIFHAELFRGGTAAKLVAPPGLELLVENLSGVKLIL